MKNPFGECIKITKYLAKLLEQDYSKDGVKQKLEVRADWVNFTYDLSYQKQKRCFAENIGLFNLKFQQTLENWDEQ